jgi:HSP20 family protein
MAKRSFFERLTGSMSMDDSYDSFEEDRQELPTNGRQPHAHAAPVEEEGAGELSIDVYQTPNEIILKALVAGVRPEDLDISITRDMVDIRGKRVEQKEVNEDDFFYRELYWGSFTRTVLLPQEVDVDSAEATEKHGLLTIRLPKINKDRQAKVKVKNG